MNKVSLLVFDGGKTESINLGIDIPSSMVVDPKTYACAIRVLRQNGRQGTVGVKDRGMVALSGRKPWRQKGTGRARAGTARSPLWRKGGVTFGPQPRVRELKMNRKQRKKCLLGMFNAVLQDKAVYCLDFDFGEVISDKKVPKTKEAVKFLQNNKLGDKKGILFLPHDDLFNFASFRNIGRVDVTSFDAANLIDFSGQQYWMFLKKDLELFKGMVGQWI